MGDDNGKNPGIHAETDALTKLKPLRCDKKLECINILVIRLSKKNNLQSSKPCINCINTIIETTKERFPNGLEIVTADGGFDVKIFIAQEILSSKLLLCEIYLGLKTQKVGGMFIIKFFDMFSHNSVIYYLLLLVMVYIIFLHHN